MPRSTKDLSRKVLVSPIAAGKTAWVAKQLPVALTCEQVKNSPDIDTDLPVSRQHEIDYFDHYSYPFCNWHGAPLASDKVAPSQS